MRRRSVLKAGGSVFSLLSAVPALSTGRQAAFGPLDSLEIRGTTEVAVDSERDVAYVAATDGFAVVDISDPANLSLLAQRRGVSVGGTPIKLLWDLWYWEDRLVVAGPAQGTSNSGMGFVLFDIADPANPVEVAAHETGYTIHNCFFADGIVYLAATGLAASGRIPLVMFDVSEDSPTEISRWSPRDHDSVWAEVPLNQRILHDVYVQESIAYLPYWDAGTWIVDVSDPTSPEVLDRFGDYSVEKLRGLSRQNAFLETTVPDGNSHYTTVNADGTLLAVGKESWAAETENGLVGGPSGVTLYDISEKTNARKLAQIDPPESYDNTREGWFTTAHNCDFAGDRLYTSWYYGGVKIHDISDPERPVEMVWWRNPRNVTFWATQAGNPGEFFVASGTMNVYNQSLPTPQTGLYTFPDRAGTQADPVSLRAGPDGNLDTPTPTSTPAPKSDPSRTPTPESDPSRTPAPTSDPSGTPVPTATDSSRGETTATPTQQTPETAGESGPGFGIGSALAALGAGYLLMGDHARDQD